MSAMVTLLSVYAAAGLLFAILFVILGIHRVDEHAHGAGVGFRLIVIPGVAALWPLLLLRWFRGGEKDPS